MRQAAALLQWLHDNDPEYFYKAEELRSAAGAWLTYVPATFHHYTSHAIDHSDEIVSQISHLLFLDDDPKRPVLERLSHVEAYILIAAAYLHDAGMVVSEQDKVDVLRSPEWKAWSDREVIARRLDGIQSFRLGSSPSDITLRNFIADLQLRYLLAEFFRRQHHVRSGSFARQNQSQLGRFAFDDPHLAAAISTVCLGHGLWHHELLDDERFPEERDIRGEKVNLRLMAILLRLGDLLDIRTERACQLLMNAACPLPPDSHPHWTQYQRVEHRVTTPGRIEIRATCETVEEHRVLRDWCKWIVDETEHGGRTMARARRHGSWRPPLATIGDARSTIQIRPRADATYLDVDWTFEIDPDAVLERLINSVHESRFGFLRELLQNSLDATRCRVYDDLESSRQVLPASPTAIAAEIRERYPIVVRLSQEDVGNEALGTVETYQLFEVADCGVGMSLNVIAKYLLQVGRSWYTTEEFTRRYSFVPSSRLLKKALP